MAFKPNYNQQRNERARAKDARKQEKLERRVAATDDRKRAREETGEEPVSGANDSGAAAGDEPEGQGA